MPILERRSTLPFSRDTVVAWHKRRTALQRMIPTWRRVEVQKEPFPLTEGAKVALRIRQFGFWLHWEFELQNVLGSNGFTDRQLHGPFANWQHVHGFSSLPTAKGESCVLEDRIEYEYPMGAMGDMVVGRGVQHELEAVFQARHVRLAQDLYRHKYEGPGKSLRIGITGSSGMVGTAMSNFLQTGGHEVVRIVRGQTQPHATDVHWDPGRGTIDSDRLEGLDAVVHLAGAGIADSRWSLKRKKLIRSSRVGGTMLLSNALASLKNPPEVLISASAIGYYGDREETVDENSGPGGGFLSDVCVEWEAATAAAVEAGIRVAIPRIGVVLSPKGGVLASLRTPAMWGLLGPVGSGEQGMSCIGLDDLVYMLHHAIVQDSIEGPFNAVCPESMSQREFARTLGSVINRPSRMPMPRPLVHLLFGEMGEKLLLEGCHAHPTRMGELGFKFSQPTIEDTLRLQLGRFHAA